MRIYLLKTPEFSEEEFLNTYSLLETFEGPLEFLKIDYEFDKEMFPFLKKFYPDFKFKYPTDITKIEFDNEKGTPLSWREPFSLCDFYRQTFNIESNDFVVLLTNRRNALNWFSAFDQNRNVFVHTNEWDSFTNANPKYPIAYQVVENIMEVLMNLDTNNLESPYIHMVPKGCMNDFCHNKEEIILKLQTANICVNCMEKIQSENIGDEIVDQVSRIFEGVRAELKFKTQTITKKEIKQLPISVTSNNKILIGNLEIRLTPLRKTLYLFFLKNRQKNETGIFFNDLSDYKMELLNIYKKVTVTGDLERIENSINSLVSQMGNTFSMEKSRINSIISDTLGEELASNYIISGQRLFPFKINIHKGLIQFQN